MTSLLILPTLRSVRKLSPHIVRNSTPRFTTAPRLLVMILTRFMEVTPMVITREMLKLVTKVTHLDLTARTMWNTSVIRFLSNMRERFQERSARPLLIQPTLRSARISSMSSVTRLMFRLTIVPRLLVMIPMLLITIPMDMDITRELLMLNQRLSQREKLLSTRRERLHQKLRLIQDMRVTMGNMTSLLTPPTLKTVRKLSKLTVRNSIPRFTTAPRLLVMILTRFMEVTPMVITREMLKLVTKVTHL